MKSESKKIFVILMILNLLAIIAIGLVVTLIYKNYNSSLSFRQQSMDELAKVSDLTSLKQIVSDTADERKYIESLFVDKEQVIDFLNFIESLGKQSGADVKVISVDEGSVEDPVNYTTIRFEAVGNWDQVFKTVSLVDHISAAFSVLDLQLNKNHVVDNGKDSILLWSATINAKVLKLHI